MVPYDTHTQMLSWLPSLKIAKVGSNQPYNKIAFAKATQVILNSVPTATHNQFTTTFPSCFFDLLYVLKCATSPLTMKQNHT